MDRIILEKMHPWHVSREGDRLKAYRCTGGALTVGRGHNCDAVPVPGVTKEGDTISHAQLEQLYTADCARVFLLLDTHLPWWRTLDVPRAAVIFDMCFNMGIGNSKHGLRSFVRTLEHMRLGNYAVAAAGMMASAWARQVGDGPGGRLDRAEILATQMETGQWQL